jgi:NAD(P)-dependent dehydrogenase (short-subunit alcohol dehydrogenase family)
MSDPVLEAKPILERFRLDGRVALVTGGGQGIGRAFAHALGEAGAAVAVVDMRLDLAEEVAHELAQKQIDAIAVQSQRHQSRRGAGDGRCDPGEVGDADHCRATMPASACGRTPSDGVRRVAARDRREPELGLSVCAGRGKGDAAAGYGKIINTASMSGHISNTPQNQAVYNTSKAGVLHLTRSLATEWAKRGVRVNSISPGYTRTKLVEDLLATPVGQTMLPTWMGMTPMARMAEVTDLQGAAVYLASAASDYMTGHDLVIDGGYCCW